jgi:hypothetical protein
LRCAGATQNVEPAAAGPPDKSRKRNRNVGYPTMHNSSRHTLVSVVATVAMVVMTVLLSVWFPTHPTEPTPNGAALVAVTSGH